MIGAQPESVSLSPEARLGQTESVSAGTVTSQTTVTTVQSAAERNLWSRQNPIWHQLPSVSKPRLATPADATADWVARHIPKSLSAFLGQDRGDNAGVITLLRQSVLDKKPVDSLVLLGPTGAGKSALVQVYLNELVGSFALTAEKHQRLMKLRVLELSNKVCQQPQDLEEAVNHFMRHRDALAAVLPRYVVVGALEKMPSKSQTTLCALLEQYAGGMRLLLCCKDRHKIAAVLKQRLTALKVTQVKQGQGLRIVLTALREERVGYELHGIREVFQARWPDLKGCLSTCRKVFQLHHFVSGANAIKVVDPARPDAGRRIIAEAAIAPVGRCPVCTLPMPCPHTSGDELVQRGLARREELPQRESSSMACQNFLRTGCCPVFNSHGHCSLHHPLDYHTVEVPPPRCPQCILRSPCGVCRYDRARTRLRKLCQEAEARVQAAEAWLQEASLATIKQPRDPHQKKRPNTDVSATSPAPAKGASPPLLKNSSPGNPRKPSGVTPRRTVGASPAAAKHQVALAARDPRAQELVVSLGTLQEALHRTLTWADATTSLDVQDYVQHITHLNAKCRATFGTLVTVQSMYGVDVAEDSTVRGDEQTDSSLLTDDADSFSSFN